MDVDSFSAETYRCSYRSNARCFGVWKLIRERNMCLFMNYALLADNLDQVLLVLGENDINSRLLNLERVNDAHQLNGWPCTYLAGSKRAEDGGRELRVVVLLLLIVLLVLAVWLVGARATVHELDGRTAVLVGDLLTESNVRDPDVTGGRNDRRFTGGRGDTPAKFAQKFSGARDA